MHCFRIVCLLLASLLLVAPPVWGQGIAGGGGSSSGAVNSSRGSGGTFNRTSSRTDSMSVSRKKADLDESGAVSDSEDSCRTGEECDRKGDNWYHKKKGSSRDDDDDDDDDEDEDEKERAPRTLGRSCVYGVNGEVIYAPGGKACGDAPAKAEPTSTRRKKAKKPATGAAGGRCILGGDGEVIYAPAGADCGR